MDCKDYIENVIKEKYQITVDYLNITSDSTITERLEALKYFVESLEPLKFNTNNSYDEEEIMSCIEETISKYQYKLFE